MLNEKWDLIILPFSLLCKRVKPGSICPHNLTLYIIKPFNFTFQNPINSLYYSFTINWIVTSGKQVSVYNRQLDNIVEMEQMLIIIQNIFTVRIKIFTVCIRLSQGILHEKSVLAKWKWPLLFYILDYVVNCINKIVIT